MNSRASAPLPQVTFVVAMNNREVFERNFLASPCLRTALGFEILVQEQFTSAAKAYNDALEKSSNDLVIFCHQDMYLPEKWLDDLQRSLDYLASTDPDWGVLGCAGITVDCRKWRYLYSSGLGIIGTPFEHPQKVQTLDEIVLILRKSSGLRFDERLPHFHFYGTDICLRASKQGMNSYALSAFCIHNTNEPWVLPPEFYECGRHIRNIWSDSLPIQTTCIRLTRFNGPVFLRRLREVYLRYIRRKEIGGVRVKDIRRLLEECAGIAALTNL
jgi:hypothetical protein